MYFHVQNHIPRFYLLYKIFRYLNFIFQIKDGLVHRTAVNSETRLSHRTGNENNLGGNQEGGTVGSCRTTKNRVR